MDKQEDPRKKRWDSKSTSCTDRKFGYFGFTPSWLQCLNNPWCFLVGVIGLTFGQGKFTTFCTISCIPRWVFEQIRIEMMVHQQI